MIQPSFTRLGPTAPRFCRSNHIQKTWTFNNSCPYGYDSATCTYLINLSSTVSQRSAETTSTNRLRPQTGFVSPQFGHSHESVINNESATLNFGIFETARNFAWHRL